jgi:hypothetical protein
LWDFLLVCSRRVVSSSLDSTRTFREVPYLSLSFLFQNRRSLTATICLSSHTTLLPQRLFFVRASFVTIYPRLIDQTCCGHSTSFQSHHAHIRDAVSPRLCTSLPEDSFPSIAASGRLLSTSLDDSVDPLQRNHRLLHHLHAPTCKTLHFIRL